RVLTTAILAAIGVALGYTHKLRPELAVAAVRILNVLKAAIAKQFGDSETGGCTKHPAEEKPSEINPEEGHPDDFIEEDYSYDEDEDEDEEEEVVDEEATR